MCIEFHWCKCNCRGRGRRFETSGTRYNEIWWSNRPQDHSTANFGALSLCSHRSPIDYPLKPKDARRFLQKTVSQFWLLKLKHSVLERIFFWYMWNVSIRMIWFTIQNTELLLHSVFVIIVFSAIWLIFKITLSKISV